MMKLHLVFALLFISTLSLAQDISLKYAGIINEASLRTHLTVIAGAEMEGRETGTEGERRAAAYIERFFDSVGISKPQPHNSYRQFFPLGKRSLVKAEFELNNKELKEGKDFLIPAGGNEDGKFKARELVFAGYGIESEKYNDYEGLDVKGKTVVLFLGEPKEDGIFVITGTGKSGEWTFPGLDKKLELAYSKGAVGALVISPTITEFTDKYAESVRKTPLTYIRDRKSKRVNYAVLSHETAEKILSNEIIQSAKNNLPFTGKYFTKKIKTEFKYQGRRDNGNRLT
ncbi:MAG: hypothetical protein EOO01_33530 [Chitinophagaceae bacterium]|nr:MAG: hypothetical protein EOO01_33530 [Chitinophagaceae bacterium]